MMIYTLFLLPALFIFFSLYFAIKKRRTQIGLANLFSLISYIAALALGTYMIFSSRSSTAAVGFVFLPFYALIPALLGFLYKFINLKPIKILSFLGLLSFYIYLMFLTFEQKKLNHERDKETERQRIEIENNKKWVKKVESGDPQEALEILAEKALSTTDRTWLIPIAESLYINSALLDILSKNSDFGVVLTVVRNPNTSTETLINIFNNHNYPGYFYNDLAQNPNTPENILLNIYSQKEKNMGIEQSLAKNKKIPMDLANKILNESLNPLALGELARNESLPCELNIKAYNKLDELPVETQYLNTGKGWGKNRFEECKSSL